MIFKTNCDVKVWFLTRSRVQHFEWCFTLARDKTAHVYMLLPVAVHGRPWRETERRLCKGIPNTAVHTKRGNVGRLRHESRQCHPFLTISRLQRARVLTSRRPRWLYIVAENLLFKILAVGNQIVVLQLVEPGDDDHTGTAWRHVVFLGGAPTYWLMNRCKSNPTISLRMH